MHETGVIKSLIHEVERVARRYGRPRVVAIKIQLGALCPVSEAHLREHLEHEAAGTVAEFARLDIVRGTNPADPLALDVALESIEIEDVLPMVARAGSVSAK